MNVFGNGVERMTADSTAPDAINHGNFIQQQNLDYASAMHLTRLSTSHSDSSVQRRKRKKSLVLEDDDIDSDSDDDSKSTRTDLDSKSNNGTRTSNNHSEIEKRRRDKMNRYISEISALVPVCAAMSRKLDKLTVMRYGVQHIKTLRGCVQTTGEGTYKPAYMTEEEVKEMLEYSADGFVFVISCDRGRILHISDSVEQVLGWNAQEMVGKCCFDFVLKEDASVLKEQMSTASNSDIGEEIMGAESVSSSTNNVMGSLSCFSPGSKRQFCCRMKSKVSSDPIHCSDQQRKQGSQKFIPVRCSGYMKAWPPALSVSQQDVPSSSGELESMPNFTCLVLLATPIDLTCTSEQDFQVFSDVCVRVNLDGTFNFCDQSISVMLGLLPREMQRRSYYDFVHEDDLEAVSKIHSSLVSGEKMISKGSYRLLTKSSSFVPVVAKWSSFRNPWNLEMEFLVVSHSSQPSGGSQSSMKNLQTSSTLKSLLSKLPSSLDTEGKNTGLKLGAGKIGEMIAVSHKLKSEDTGSPKSIIKISQDKLSRTKQLGELSSSGSGSAESRNNNEETTMSVLMSLLDSDGALGGHGDYTEIPWSL